MAEVLWGILPWFVVIMVVLLSVAIACGKHSCRKKTASLPDGTYVSSKGDAYVILSTGVVRSRGSGLSTIAFNEFIEGRDVIVSDEVVRKHS